MQGTVYPGDRRASVGRSFGRKGFSLMQGESLSQSRAEPYPGIVYWATHMAFASPKCHRRSVLHQNAGYHDSICVFSIAFRSTAVIVPVVDFHIFPTLTTGDSSSWCVGLFDKPSLVIDSFFAFWNDRIFQAHLIY